MSAMDFATLGSQTFTKLKFYPNEIFESLLECCYDDVKKLVVAFLYVCMKMTQ